jgi:hypothetical protein
VALAWRHRVPGSLIRDMVTQSFGLVLETNPKLWVCFVFLTNLRESSSEEVLKFSHEVTGTRAAAARLHGVHGGDLRVDQPV